MADPAARFRVAPDPRRPTLARPRPARARHGRAGAGGGADDEAGAAPLRDLLSEQAFALEHDGESLFHRFLGGPGAEASGLSRRYLRRLASAPLLPWRVLAVEPGAGLSVSPWRGGETVTVSGRELSRGIRVHGLLLTRLIDMPAGPVFGSGLITIRHIAPRRLPDSPDAVRHLLSLWTSELLGGTGGAETGTRTGAGAGARSDRGGAGATARDGSGSRPADPSPTGPDRERLLDRVRKLFAMAQEVEASPHEAEIALRRCQSLMMKYGITEADLETSAFGNAELATGRTVPMHVKYLAAAVARLHDVLFVTGPGGFAEFRGFEVDANVARLTLDYLLDAVERALAGRKRAGDFPAGRSAAYDYRVGFAIEVDRRVGALAAERERAERQAGGPGTSLAVRKRQIVERECAGDLSTTSFRGRGARDAAARAAGRDDGARVSLERQVGDSSGRPALPRR